MKTETRTIDMSNRTFLDLTSDARSFVAGEGDGLLNVFAPHATAGLALIETGSGSEEDLESILEELLPREHPYRHRHGTPGHGRDQLGAGGGQAPPEVGELMQPEHDDEDDG